MIRRRHFLTGLGGLALTGLGGCVTSHQTDSYIGIENVPPGYRPNPKSDEAGLWLQIEREEKSIRTSENRIRDKAITSLCQDMMCRLVGNYCPDLRTVVVRLPTFNASCYPNGLVVIHSGLLLRCRSESELAAVLGHEFGHYLRRHSLASIREERFRAGLLASLAVIANQGYVNAMTLDLNEMARAAFSRDNEREADELGLKLMADAGYDPFAGVEVWNRRIAENKTGNIHEEAGAYDTHPSSKERVKNLTKLAEERGKPNQPPPDRLADAMVSARGPMLRDEVNLGRFHRTAKLLDELIEEGRRPGEILYYRGELHRRRGKEGDDSLALGYYHDACEADGAPPEAFRTVGLIRWRSGEKEYAREYFQRYLRMKPDADDRQMIQSYITGA